MERNNRAEKPLEQMTMEELQSKLRDAEAEANALPGSTFWPMRIFEIKARIADLGESNSGK